MLTSITLTKDEPFELSKKITEYVTYKNIQKINLTLIREKEKKKTIRYFKDNFHNIEDNIRDAMLDEGTNILIDIPNIKTSFEEFTYGIEANSYESDFKKFFEEFIVYL